MSQQEPPQQPQRPYPAEDEIDLADLAAVLYRRRWVIVGGALVVLALAIAYPLFQTPKYETRTILEIGQLQREGGFHYVEPPQAAAGRLQAAARKEIQSIKAGGEDPSFSVKNGFTTEPSKEAGIVEVSLEAPPDADSKAFLERVTASLVGDHERILEVEQQKFEQRIKTLRAKVDELENKVQSHKRRLKLLDQERAFLKDQVEKATGRMDELLQSKVRANLQDGGEPVALMLFSSEIQRVRSYVDQLRTRLLAEIPQTQEKYRMQLESIRSRLTETRASLESQRIALQNMIQTRPILEPTVSEDPVSPNLKLNAALGLVLGGFLSVFAAFLTEFWVNNRQRITES